MRLIFHPGDPSKDHSLGGKAAALAALHDRGLPIPDWFVILPQAFETSVAARNQQSDPATPLVPPSPTPAVMQQVHAALAKLCPAGELVAVRSSALEEDGSAHSFAGQLESFLMVLPAKVGPAITAVWNSAFSERVRAYRAQHQLTGPPRPPAVLIQRMVRAEAAGVAFGADPITGRRDVAVISAVPGLGTSLVNGERDADTWHVDASGRILHGQLAQPAPDSLVGQTHLERQGTATPKSPAPTLTDRQIRAIAQLVRRAGELQGGPQDIEWAMENGQLYLLQSRPITTAIAPGPLNIWDNSNIIESYSGVTRPLTFSFAQRAYTGVYRQFCQMLAVPKHKILANESTFRNMLGLIRGRVYYNLLNWYRVLALLPGFTLNRRFMEQMMGVKEELPAEILSELGNASLSDRFKDGLHVGFSLAALVTNHFLLPRKIRRFYQRLNEALAPPARPLEAMTAQELSAHFLDLEARLLTRWDAPLLNDFLAMIFYGVLRRLTTSWAGDAEGTLQNDLLCGEGGMISAEPAARIRTLAQLAAPHSHLVQLLCDGPLPAIIAALESAPQFKSAYLEYLAKFGDRCLEELKLESPSLHDDPLLLLRSVGRLARRGLPESTVDVSPGEPGVRQQAEARVHRALAGHALRRIVFRWVLRHTRARVRDRENLRFERTRLFGRVRRIFVELGRRLHSKGHLSDPREVFLLEVDEVLSFVAGTAPTVPLRDVVVRRQAEFMGYQVAEPPPNRFTTQGLVGHDISFTAVSPQPHTGDPNQRKGIGCCPGVRGGRVRKVIDPRQASIQPGEILVAARTDPGWILLFPAAAGLLVERGSLLSHSAIVAREMRIPAIVSIDGLMDWLNDGDLVEFDGGTGVVRRMEASLPGGAEIRPASLPSVDRVLPRDIPVTEWTPVAS